MRVFRSFLYFLVVFVDGGSGLSISLSVTVGIEGRLELALVGRVRLDSTHVESSILTTAPSMV